MGEKGEDKKTEKLTESKKRKEKRERENRSRRERQQRREYDAGRCSGAQNVYTHTYTNDTYALDEFQEPVPFLQ